MQASTVPYLRLPESFALPFRVFPSQIEAEENARTAKSAHVLLEPCREGEDPLTLSANI